MKKIVFVIADITFIGGIERVITLLANEFAKRSYAVEILSLYKTNDKVNYVLDDNITITYVNKHAYAGSPGSVKRLFFHLRSQIKLYRALKKSSADFFMLNSFPMAFLSLPALILKGRFFAIEHVHYKYYGFFTRFVRNFIYRF